MGYRLMESESPILKYAFAGEEKDGLRAAALGDPFVASLMEELSLWPGPVLKRHNDAKLLLHKLAFLAELGFTVDDGKLGDICRSILSHRSAEGVVQVLVNIPKNFGGSGEDSFSWMLCDAPLLHYSLHKLGVEDHELIKGTEYLFAQGQSYGYPCASSPDLGRFNGPGRRGTICPYATLLMLRLYSLFPGKHKDIWCLDSIEALIGGIQSREKAYLFGSGKNFRKLKYPFIWFDILHVLEVLSRFESARRDSRFLALVDEMNSRADEEGLFKAGSVWTAWKGIDAGQKRDPSLWITYAVGRINARLP
ncbi:MAG: hypothetical protein JXR86_11905 [Spirochaetales bacterium]|nr:hypothetical protein [Spirochaetales bacterium]